MTFSSTARTGTLSSRDEPALPGIEGRIVALTWTRERPLTPVAEAVIGWAVAG
jgi:hypothetical protein